MRTKQVEARRRETRKMTGWPQVVIRPRSGRVDIGACGGFFVSTIGLSLLVKVRDQLCPPARWTSGRMVVNFGRRVCLVVRRHSDAEPAAVYPAFDICDGIHE